MSGAPALMRRGVGGVVTITLNRPEKMNAITFEMFSLLTDFAAELRYDRAVKAVILTGAGRAFTAGRDVKGGDKEPPMHVADAEAFMHDTIKALEALPMPLIAAVNGPCFTGGLELVLAADIIIAARSATFCDTHAELGIVPGWGLSVRLPRRVGYAAAKLMSWTARRYSGEQAADIGLADLVVDDDALMTTAAELATDIARNSSESIAKQKKMLNYARSTTERDAIWVLDSRGLHPGGTSDSKERSEALFGAGGGPGWGSDKANSGSGSKL